MLGANLFGLLCVAALAYGDKQVDTFEYHAKLLEKMIHIEKKMERMENDLKQAKTEVNIFINDQTNILENKTAEYELLEGKVDLPIIAFNAYQVLDTSPETNQIMIWQHIRLNEGNAYDNVVGKFKAPVSGLYHFAVHICNNSGQVITYAIVLDGTYIAQSYKYDNAIVECGSISAITKVTTGQMVWVKCISGSASTSQIWNPPMSSFTGALIHRVE
ncbi:heavy metal-binding protein HIP-like [Ruditapes philippinarum]|uniref:heavy metal-binding protein HIP-like n=1 Tax=Ruditapes philippinarum TaxID=129788 RepID=UPI00295B5AB9|nr:heavy metal-binding protein HIP-like [Ruditapes philippinarum]